MPGPKPGRAAPAPAPMTPPLGTARAAPVYRPAPPAPVPPPLPPPPGPAPLSPEGRLDDDILGGRGGGDETPVESPFGAMAPRAATSSSLSVTAVPESAGDSLSAFVRQQSTPDGESAYFRQVYEDFIALKRKCGENTDSLTYEKFLVKLTQNRDQLIAKYACKAVKFQVYVKDGKAALKATPVKA
jgi:hypothetical protein